MAFEFKVVPAPTKGTKAKGVKTPEARFALAIEDTINALAAEGWEYQRSDVLPSEERQGLTGSATHWRTLLVFRRSVLDEMVEDLPVVASARREPVLSATPQAPSAPSTAEADTAPVTAKSSTESHADDDAQPKFEEGNEETRPA